MSKSSRFVLIVFSILAIILLGSGYKILRQQYAENANQKDVPAPDYFNEMTENTPDNSSNNPDGSEPEQENGADTKEEGSKDLPDDRFLEVTGQDCQNKCIQFKSDAENFKYCQNFCGLNSTNKKITSCDTLEDLEKDYCWKDLAINKKDFAACGNIKDSGIKKTCKNRVTEEVLNGNEKTPEIIN